MQNPHHFLHVGRHVTCDTWLPCRYARQYSSSMPSPPLTREKVRPARGFRRLIREKVRPAQHLQRHFREKTRPASPKTPKLGCFQRAGRTISRSRTPSGRAGRTNSRSHPQTGRAGRTNSRTGHSHAAALKPVAPLQPSMQAIMKPPSPLRTPEQQPLKPMTPLQPKNTPQTPISHPQRRRQFQLRLALREQR